MAILLLILIYIAFISLGLPDALLGAGWPVIQPEFGVGYGFAGLVQMAVSGGTIVSSFLSGRVLARFGTGRVTAISVAFTCVALFGYAFAPSFLWLLVFAVPLGLGAGAVDSGLNAYVAAHYESRHMSWLHSFWGIGALSGPLVLSALLSRGLAWRKGYLGIAIFQLVLVIVLVLAVPLWDKIKERLSMGQLPEKGSQRALLSSLSVKGVGLALTVFFFYCGVESTMGLWGGSFLFLTKGMDAAAAATWVSLFYASITLGRILSGFITFRVSNSNLIRTGSLVVLAGVVLMLVPGPQALSPMGFVLVGFGCAPIFPCMLHETPVRFGVAQSRAIMGIQLAVSYIGATILPLLFGFIAANITLALLPVFLVVYSIILLASSEMLRMRTSRDK